MENYELDTLSEQEILKIYDDIIEVGSLDSIIASCGPPFCDNK